MTRMRRERAPWYRCCYSVACPELAACEHRCEGDETESDIPANAPPAVKARSKTHCKVMAGSGCVYTRASSQNHASLLSRASASPLKYGARSQWGTKSC